MAQYSILVDNKNASGPTTAASCTSDVNVTGCGNWTLPDNNPCFAASMNGRSQETSGSVLAPAGGVGIGGLTNTAGNRYCSTLWSDSSAQGQPPSARIQLQPQRGEIGALIEWDGQNYGMNGVPNRSYCNNQSAAINDENRLDFFLHNKNLSGTRAVHHCVASGSVCNQQWTFNNNPCNGPMARVNAQFPLVAAGSASRQTINASPNDQVCIAAWEGATTGTEPPTQRENITIDETTAGGIIPWQNGRFGIPKTFYACQGNGPQPPPLPEVPVAPTSLTAMAASSNQINLTWIAPTSGNQSGYRIERRQGTGSFTIIDTVNANATSYTDTGLSPNTLYTYRILAFNEHGSSSYSNQVSTTTSNGNGPTPPIFVVPIAPSNLTATTVSSSQIRLNWTRNSVNETGFQIQRRTAGTGYVNVTQVDSGVTTYLDSGLNPNTTYSYRVSAVNDSGQSPHSNTASTTTSAAGDRPSVTPPPSLPPASPSGLIATAVSSSEINLSWADKSNNETGFTIHRKTGTGSFTNVGSVGQNVTTFRDTGLARNTLYEYRVQAFNTSGSSDFSNTATANTTGEQGFLERWWWLILIIIIIIIIIIIGFIYVNRSPKTPPSSTVVTTSPPNSGSSVVTTGITQRFPQTIPRTIPQTIPQTIHQPILRGQPIIYR